MLFVRYFLVSNIPADFVAGTSITSRKRPHSPITPVTNSPSTSTSLDKPSPGILKRQRRVSRDGNEKTTRLRFSDVNDYNYVDQVPFQVFWSNRLDQSSIIGFF